MTKKLWSIWKIPKKRLKIKTIEQLKEIAENLTGVPEKIEYSDKIVGVVEYRDGTIIDVIRKSI